MADGSKYSCNVKKKQTKKQSLLLSSDRKERSYSATYPQSHLPSAFSTYLQTHQTESRTRILHFAVPSSISPNVLPTCPPLKKRRQSRSAAYTYHMYLIYGALLCPIYEAKLASIHRHLLCVHLFCKPLDVAYFQTYV